jgi:hypothetical protein
MSEEVLEPDGGLHHQPGLAPGLLACLPLFLLYELGVLAGGAGAARNGAESLLTLPLAPLGGWVAPARWGGLALLAILAWHRTRTREELELPRGLLRAPLEGFFLALGLGPILLWMLTFFDASGFTWDLPTGPTPDTPGLGRALRLVGAAPWEELLFRVALYGVLFLWTARTLGFFGVGRSAALLAGDLVALLGSSVGFAAFHLEALQELLGREGEPFDGAVFLWRLLAGLVLAGIFRWRGLGAAAWTHGLFNVALALGAGPGVFLAGPAAILGS